MAPSPAEPHVEVLYALPEDQTIVVLPYVEGMTAAAAVERSGLLARYPKTVDRALVLGVFGVPVAPEDAIKPGDRVEICRPLKADPRSMRRALVDGGRVMGGAESKQRPREK
jgi:hypothetical protein